MELWHSHATDYIGYDFQGKQPVLQYKMEGAYLLSQAHFHHELTVELLEPCVGRIVDLLTNPRPESSSKVAPKKGQNGNNQGPPPLPSPQQANDTVAPGASQSTLLGTMVCTSFITNLAR
jgi:hypothetical protein